ncbi:phosphotransferase [Sediminicoccus sp. KRV36]|uniref:aminoglycoside phosphotransferase family protein n=1 Tax=Sediminicoccus sp. KRV36 TaxID=3133721 RepID=UPI00200CC5DE|nr:phosphotransferase [Sediminicoccus rosea]UPY36947.1 phosphotransferase [Sediminicoccus rosea]
MTLLDAHGYATARQDILQADASKHYIRLSGGPRPALLMRTPSAEYLDAFLRVARHLESLGVPAPGVIGVEAATHTALVQDLGRASMADALDAGAEAAPLYFDAARSLVALHAAPPPAGLPAWDAAAMIRATEATFCDWWWPATFGTPCGPEIRQGLGSALAAMLAPFAGEGFVHRDYFPANLIPTPRGMAVIDFQDAATGHPAYDLVSLVEDARRDVDPALREAVVSAYLAQRPGLDAEGFRAAMAVHAAQRHLRVAALWVRLDRRDGKPHYLRHGPRCWALLGRALEHPAAMPLARFLDAHLPAGRRQNP